MYAVLGRSGSEIAPASSQEAGASSLSAPTAQQQLMTGFVSRGIKQVWR